MVTKKIILFSFLLLAFTTIYSMEQSPSELKVAVLGLGGRCQGLLLECLKQKQHLNRNIKVIAVCDDNGQASLDFFIEGLKHKQHALIDDYRNIFRDVVYYPNTGKGLYELFKDHSNIDRVFVTSANNDHYRHLNAVLEHSNCTKIFLEKPLFRTLEEFTQFQARDLGQTVVHIGLVLRYANMTKIVVEQLHNYKEQLGTLKKVQSWDSLNFSHALTIIMMNWRRYHSLSGGLLIEKSIHDLDLTLYFMQALGIDIHSLTLSTKTSHELFKKSKQDEIIQTILNDLSYEESVEDWKHVPFQRRFDFTYNEQGKIDWHKTFDDFFKEFPDNDDFTTSDIIPDSHTLNATIHTTDKGTIDYRLDVALHTFDHKTKRGIALTCEHGDVFIDIEESTMKIVFKDQASVEFDLQANGLSHAGGDQFIAQTIFESLQSGQHSATSNDPAVKLATLMGLLSEQQALNGNKPVTIKKSGSSWEYN